MKKTFINLCVAVAVTAGLAAPEARAQLAETPEQSGTAAAEHLLVPVTAHAAGLANAFTSGVSSLSGLEGAMMNPAALMLNQGTGAMFSRMQYVADIGVNSFGVAQRFGNNNVALQITAWDFGDIERREESDPNGEGDLTYTASDIVVGATFARQFTDRVSAGVTAKFINESIDDMSGSAVAFDAGMTYEVGASGLRFGVSLRNFGPSLSYGGNGLVQDIPVGSNGTIAGEVAAVSNELPSMLNFGVAYTRALSGDITGTVLGNFRSNAYDADNYSAALELGYANLFFVRGGAELRTDMDQTFYQGWNVGAGLNYTVGTTRIFADYAYRGTDFFDGVNLFTVGLGF